MTLRGYDLLIAYTVTAIIFLLVDLVWLGLVADGFYSRHIGPLLKAEVNWPAAVLFYLLYVGGIVGFVLDPALSGGAGFWQVARRGGALGLLAYGTFDLTALALLQGWPPLVAIVDMLWGTALTGLTAACAAWVLRRHIPRPQWSSPQS